MKIKKLFAYYSTTDRKIYDVGETKGMIYLHEKRHEYQDKEGIISSLFVINYLIALISILLSIWKKEFLWIAPMMTISLMMLLEIDAWIYAITTNKRVEL